MKDFMIKMENTGILPVISENNLDNAMGIVKAVKNGGLDVVEIDYSMEKSNEILNCIYSDYPKISCGVSGIRTIEEVKNAVENGAKYISPKEFDLEIIDYCMENSIIVIPTVSTIREVEAAVKHGIEVLKILPIKSLGEKNPIIAISENYKPVKVIAYGEVGTRNITEYLKIDGVISCGIDFSLPAGGPSEENIELLSKEIDKLILHSLDFSLCHVGINSHSEEEALKTANMFSKIFGLKTKEEVPSYFSGTIVEVMKFMGKGKNGHIAIGTTNIERAINYISKMGIEFDKNTFAIEDGIIVRAYLKEEIAGFGVHLIRKN